MNQVQSVPDSSLVSGVMNTLENSYMQVFATLAWSKRISSEVFEDYLEFCEVAREMFYQLGGKFSLPLVYKMLPDNTWVSFYKQHANVEDVDQAPLTVH